MSKKRDMHLVPYCGMRNPPKNRRPGTLDECLKAGQVRYYGVQAQTTKINDYIKNQKKLANEKAKIKRQQATKSATDAKKKIKEANVAVRKAKKDQLEAKKADNEAKKTPAKKPAVRAKKASAKKIKPISLTSNKKIKPL